MSWKVHRDRYRSGSLAMTLLSYDDANESLPQKFLVSPNYSNHLTLQQISILRLLLRKLLVSIYDISGRLITPFNKKADAVSFIKVEWQNFNGEPMPTGIYFVQVDQVVI